MHSSRMTETKTYTNDNILCQHFEQLGKRFSNSIVIIIFRILKGKNLKKCNIQTILHFKQLENKHEKSEDLMSPTITRKYTTNILKGKKKNEGKKIATYKQYYIYFYFIFL